MNELIIYLLQVLVCSGVLLAFYAILFERRVKHLWCRIFLLLSTPVAVVIPLLNIPIWPVNGVVATIATGELGVELLAAQIESTISWMMIVVGIYGLGVVLILGSMLLQLSKIRALKGISTTQQTGGYVILRTQERIAAFSFFRTIYIWWQTPDEHLSAIIAHELSHVAHRHSLERVVMELMKALVWWNPFVWVVAHKLTEVEEFEADGDVLDSGFDTMIYMSTIFHQLFGYSPDIANGLRHSLTKKRFEMMNKKLSGRYSLLRLAATLPIVVALLSAFSFTTRASIASPEDRNIADSQDIHIALPPETEDAEEPRVVVDVMPKFGNGNLITFRSWVGQNLVYPPEAFKAKIQGRVAVTFVIERDGSISNIVILQSPDVLLSDETVRVLKTSPKWTPGRSGDKVVRVKYTLPVDFVLTKGADQQPK